MSENEKEKGYVIREIELDFIITLVISEVVKGVMLESGLDKEQIKSMILLYLGKRRVSDEKNSN